MLEADAAAGMAAAAAAAGQPPFFFCFLSSLAFSDRSLSLYTLLSWWLLYASLPTSAPSSAFAMQRRAVSFPSSLLPLLLLLHLFLSHRDLFLRKGEIINHGLCSGLEKYVVDGLRRR
jgi:hypothetical protein